MKNPGTASRLTALIKLWLGIYIIGYAFPFPFTYIPYLSEYVFRFYYLVREKFILFIGKNLLGLSELQKIQMTGSGDTTFDYAALAAFALLALFIGTLVFFLKKDRSYIAVFYAWCLVYARYFVGINLIQYGVIKFLEGQFPGPGLYALEQSFGEFSPMGLAWKFFGYSATYKAFMGVSELLAGFLLIFRRTAILGALVSLAVTTNIVLVNFSFDVPVKLFSSHLLFFSLLVVLPSARPIIGFFLLKENRRLNTPPLLLTTRKQRIGWVVAKVFLVLFIPASMIVGHYMSQSYRKFPNEFAGTYTVSSDLTRMDSGAAPVVTWEKIILDKNQLVIFTSGKNTHFYQISTIEPEGNIVLAENNNNDSGTLLLQEKEDSTYHITGTLGDKILDINARRKMKEEYPLIQRGFHWINEYPYNR